MWTGKTSHVLEKSFQKGIFDDSMKPINSEIFLKYRGPWKLFVDKVGYKGSWMSFKFSLFFHKPLTLQTSTNPSTGSKSHFASYQSGLCSPYSVGPWPKRLPIFSCILSGFTRFRTAEPLYFLLNCFVLHGMRMLFLIKAWTGHVIVLDICEVSNSFDIIKVH